MPTCAFRSGLQAGLEYKSGFCLHCVRPTLILHTNRCEPAPTYTGAYGARFRVTRQIELRSGKARALQVASNTRRSVQAKNPYV